MEEYKGDLLINALKLMKSEVEWEYSIEYAAALDVVIELLTPKSPDKRRFINEVEVGYCPHCNTGVNMDMKHCMECGQALDWGIDDQEVN